MVRERDGSTSGVNDASGKDAVDFHNAGSYASARHGQFNMPSWTSDGETTCFASVGRNRHKRRSCFDPTTPRVRCTLTGDNQRYGEQASCGPFTVNANTDYVVELSARIAQGRMRVSVEDANGRAYMSEILEPLEIKQPAEQPVQTIRLPFVSLSNTAQIDLSNEASNAPPNVQLNSVKLYELGPARFLWTRYPRMLLHGLQKLFTTAVFLPLALIGVGITIFRKRTAVLIILSVVPLYYFTVQSAFHTEYRYVLAVNYFLFAFAAVVIAWVVPCVGSRTERDEDGSQVSSPR